jgi:hypothetical protein
MRLKRPAKKKSSASRIAIRGAEEISMAWLRAADGPLFFSNLTIFSLPLASSRVPCGLGGAVARAVVDDHNLGNLWLEKSRFHSHFGSYRPRSLRR